MFSLKEGRNSTSPVGILKRHQCALSACFLQQRYNLSASAVGIISSLLSQPRLLTEIRYKEIKSIEQLE
jgi:hypothetical protein